jgi:UDP-glucose 4-epimerase
MAVLVTGGAGYIGSHTAIELLESGKEIVIIDNFYNSCPKVLDRIKELSGKDFHFEECDIRDREALDKVFEKYDIDSVIHFAGLKAVGESCQKPLLYYENNISGTVTLCEAMAAHNCKKIVFSSSATVYGEHNISPLKETMVAGGTTNPYGTTKFFIEQILTDLAKSDPEWGVCILRYFNPIGAHPSALIGELPRGVPNNLVPFITQTAIGKRECLSIFGNDYPTEDGTCLRDYIDIVDLAKAHVAAVTRMVEGKMKQGYEIFNVGTGRPVSVYELVSAFEKVNDVKLNYKYVARRPGDVMAIWADTTLANEELGWKAERTVEETLASAWAWEKHIAEK